MTEPTYITVTVRIKKHGRSGYNRGCRCSVCREATAAYKRASDAERRQRSEQAPHGTRGGYSNWGCRCEPCKKVHSDYMKAWREART